MYERAGSLDTAAETAAEALCWGRAGHLARKAGWGRERMAELSRELLAGLEGQGRGLEAATVAREWLEDPEEGVAVLARCHCWGEAIRGARAGGREDLIETHVLPALQERREVVAGSVGARGRELGQWVARLGLVRRSRTAAMLGEGEEEDDRNLEDADLFSDTTSVGGAPSTVRTR